MVEDQLFVPAVERLEEQLRNQIPLHPAVAPSNLLQAEDKLGTLSEREKVIIACVAKGMSNKEIADTLCLSVNTVTTHRRNITKKLQIHTSNGLTIYAIVNKLVELQEINLS